MLREEDKKEIQNRLKELTHPVQLMYFTQSVIGTCQFCLETEHLLKEVVPLSDLLSLSVKNFITDQDDVQKYRIDKIPAIVLLEGETDKGLRIYGIPSGYEFITFLETLIHLGTRDSGLAQESRTALKNVRVPIHIQVFVTPTCPYCPRAAVTGFQLAQESEFIACDVVEISEFPHLAQRYGVMGVPKVVINEKYGFEGALPERLFVEQILHVAQSMKKGE